MQSSCPQASGLQRELCQNDPLAYTAQSLGRRTRTCCAVRRSRSGAHVLCAGPPSMWRHTEPVAFTPASIARINAIRKKCIQGPPCSVPCSETELNSCPAASQTSLLPHRSVSEPLYVYRYRTKAISSKRTESLAPGGGLVQARPLNFTAEFAMTVKGVAERSRDTHSPTPRDRVDDAAEKNAEGQTPRRHADRIWSSSMARKVLTPAT